MLNVKFDKFTPRELILNQSELFTAFTDEELLMIEQHGDDFKKSKVDIEGLRKYIYNPETVEEKSSNKFMSRVLNFVKKKKIKN